MMSFVLATYHWTHLNSTQQSICQLDLTSTPLLFILLNHSTALWFISSYAWNAKWVIPISLTHPVVDIEWDLTLRTALPTCSCAQKQQIPLYTLKTCGSSTGSSPDSLRTTGMHVPPTCLLNSLWCCVWGRDGLTLVLENQTGSLQSGGLKQNSSVAKTSKSGI